LKAQAKIKNIWGQEMKPSSNKKTAASYHMPNFGNMTMNKRKQDSMRQPYGSQRLTSFEAFERDIDNSVSSAPVMSNDILNVLRNIEKSGLLNSKKSILNESSDSNEPNEEEGSS
jgi:hypothetical protein